MSIIDKINKTAPSLTENDLNSWVIPELLLFYQNKIEGISHKVYNSYNTVSSSAFKEIAKQEIHFALNTFLFKAEHWRAGRDINSYLITTISRLGNKVKSEIDAIKRINALICPLCKENNIKEFLIQEDNLWRCNACSNRIDNKNDLKLDLYKIFYLHSRKGYKCPECCKFIPNTYLIDETVMCPYIECSYFGFKTDLQIMAHPVSSTQIFNLSLQANPDFKSQGNSNTTYQDNIKSENIDADTRIHVQENFKIEYDTLLKAIQYNIDLIKKNNQSMQKMLMFEAFKIMTEKYPDDMISYLVHRQQKLDSPIQCKIFQQYADLIENYLPITITKGGKDIDIADLADPNLGLFLGISKFETEVSSNNIINNEIKEEYIGTRGGKNFGKRLIGKLIDIIDISKYNSILNNVKEYGFCSITVDENIKPGTKVIVSCWGIPPHPETATMHYLQRCRKSIVKKLDKNKGKIE